MAKIYKQPTSQYYYFDIPVPLPGGRTVRIRRTTGETDPVLAQQCADTISEQAIADARKRILQAELRAHSLQHGKMLSDYVAKWKAVPGRTESDILSIEKFMEGFEDVPIAEFAEDIAGIDRRLREFVHTRGTYERYRSRIAGVIKMAIQQASGDGAPLPVGTRVQLMGWAPQVKTKATLREKSRPPRPLRSSKDLDKLLSFLPDHQRRMVLFAVFTGLRQRNVLTLTWGHIDFSAQTANFEGREMKNGRPLQIKLNKDAFELLKQIRESDSADAKYVFVYRGKPIKEIKTAFRIACHKAGLGQITKMPCRDNKQGFTQKYTGLRWHDLRHTFVTWHIEARTPHKAIQGMVGWQNLRMIDVYGNPSEQFTEQFTNNIGRKKGAEKTSE